MCSLYSYIFGFNCGLPAPDGNANYAAKLQKITFSYSTRSHIYLNRGSRPQLVTFSRDGIDFIEISGAPNEKIVQNHLKHTIIKHILVYFKDQNLPFRKFLEQRLMKNSR